MVTIEVNLKEGDDEPEQHLEEGEHIERVVVPLDQLYEKLQGMSPLLHPTSFPMFFLPLLPGVLLQCERIVTASPVRRPKSQQKSKSQSE
jgi:hypothetical protein